MSDARTTWHKVADLDELPEDRVRTVVADGKWICLTHVDGRYGALDNHCPHQGGPLGEGTIENGLLRCPWHGWDYCPLTGASPAGFDERVPSYPVEVRDDGIYVGIEPEPAPSETVSDVMARTLCAWGVRHVFGMVGHSNLGLADALRRRTEAGELEYVAVRHEGAAAFAASAYGKLTGRPAACLTIAGPGATNLLTGLWDAKVDRAPVLALTGQVQTQVFGPGAFQEIDLSSAFGAVARFSHTVLPSSRHGELMSLACKHALVERDVAHLIFPDDVQDLEAPTGATIGSPAGRIGDVEITPPPAALAAATERLRAAKRPLIVLGHGARGRTAGVVELAERLGACVVTTFKGKGLIGDDHPLAGGVLGRSGTPIASWFMNECDLICVFGASFSNHTGITTHKPIVQVDYDRSQLARFHAVDVPVWGEIDVTARALAAQLERDPGANDRVDQRTELAERWALWRAEKARRRADDRGRGVNSAAVFEALGRLCDPRAIVAVDVGNNTYSFGRYFECRDNAVLMSGYLGSIGFGYPAAMGAWAATRTDDPAVAGRQVLCVTGDGGFGQYLAEVTTAVRHGMNITHVLLNNSELGKISKEQASGEWPVWQTDLVNPDFAAYVTSCGGLGIRVTDVADLDAALERALAHDGPATVEVLTDVELV
ncbi:Putative thiamine pyrophosphate-containing protein YdaP [Planctomycetes bacterium Pla163]|uniref:Thiamine pyrophosphate-containing protein YdaP n=1 Tax=Rohdeia mirabilis TaxID=2528008 RepID=A0A518CZZ9_9BACT|nr:Putative thiamine pyrophosphate-containing protein YdaP [Planctomycetes bacterium Pla163]